MQETFLSFNQIFKHANQKWNIFVAPKKFAIKTKIASIEYCIQNAGQNNALVVKECSDNKDQHWYVRSFCKYRSNVFVILDV